MEIIDFKNRVSKKANLKTGVISMIFYFFHTYIIDDALDIRQTKIIRDYSLFDDPFICHPFSWILETIILFISL